MHGQPCATRGQIVGQLAEEDCRAGVCQEWLGGGGQASGDALSLRL